MPDAQSQRPPSDPLDPATLELVGDGEVVVDHVVGLGATLVVTETGVIIVREGAHFRPRNGVRSWPFGTFRDVQLLPPKRGSGRVVIRVGGYPWQAASLFVDVAEWAAAERVVGKIHTLVAMTRTSPPKIGADDS
jgi:hypothetical protein